MEALQRTVISSNWITLLFMFSSALIFLVKILNPAKLKGYAGAVFNRGFLEKEAAVRYASPTLFHLSFYLFFFLMLSVSVYFMMHHYTELESFLFKDYSKYAQYLLVYQSIKYIADLFLMVLFELKERLSFFFISKIGYSYSISIGLFVANVLYFYSFRSSLFLIFICALLFSIRMLLIIIHNKNLIAKELFYFILYLCVLELAPLFVLFKFIF